MSLNSFYYGTFVVIVILKFGKGLFKISEEYWKQIGGDKWKRFFLKSVEVHF